MHVCLALLVVLSTTSASSFPASRPATNTHYRSFRPQAHFSPAAGFMNVNPSGLTIGNQHWGHATSTDLYHWTDHPIAISPETTEEAIFSGSAVVDRNNTSGFFPNQTNGVVAMYTLHTVDEQSQHIAYSQDGGYTFTKHRANPVIAVGSTEFRDPKLFWHAPTSRWVVLVAFAQDYVIGVWTSQNLREWTHASNFTHWGILGLQYECPSLVPIPTLKNSSISLPWLLDSSNMLEDAGLWLMLLSINPGAPLGGSTMQYMPGRFNGTHFTPLDNAARLSEFAKDNYAGQFFAEISSVRPQISIQWASNWQYANSVPTEIEGFRGVMALPRLHVLANTTRTPYALFSLPVPLNPLYTTSQPLLRNKLLANSSLGFEYGSINPSGALTFSVTAEHIPREPRGFLNFTFLSTLSDEWIRGGLLMQGDSTFFLDRSGVHRFNNPLFTGQFSVAHPIDEETRRFRMDIVIDRSVIEVFLDNGARSATMLFFSKAPMDMLVISSGELEKSVSVEAEVWGLQSIWAQRDGAMPRNVSQILQHNLLSEICNC